MDNSFFVRELIRLYSEFRKENLECMILGEEITPLHVSFPTNSSFEEEFFRFLLYLMAFDMSGGG